MVNGWQWLGSMAMERMPSIYLFWGIVLMAIGFTGLNPWLIAITVTPLTTIISFAFNGQLRKIPLIAKVMQSAFRFSTGFQLIPCPQTLTHQGKTSPLACQKVPLLVGVNASMRASRPRTDCSGLIPLGLN